MRILIPNKTSRVLFLGLISAHVIGTLFAYIVYAKLSSLGDGYQPEDFERIRGLFGSDFNRTVVVWRVYYYTGAVFPGLLAPMFLGIVIAVLTWHAFRDIYFYLDKKLFWICNLFPHFLVWSGASSKEQIVIICGLIVVSFVANHSFGSRNLNISALAAFTALGLIFIIRPNYFIIYFTIYVIALMSSYLNSTILQRLSVGVWVFGFASSIFLLIFILNFHETFFKEDVINFMLATQRGFLAYTSSGSNRINIQWNEVSDFFYNALWGIPQGFIGPTFLEIFAKPLQAPAFLEGVIYLFTILYLLYMIVKLAVSNRYLRIHIFPFIFVGFCIIFVSYPYLIFNPGAALRYKQSLHPLLVFYPLLILGHHRVKQHMNNE